MLVSSEPASFMSEMLGYVVFILIPLLLAVWWANKRR